MFVNKWKLRDTCDVIIIKIFQILYQTFSSIHSKWMFYLLLLTFTSLLMISYTAYLRCLRKIFVYDVGGLQFQSRPVRGYCGTKAIYTTPELIILPSARLINTYTFINIEEIYTFITSNLTTKRVLAGTKTKLFVKKSNYLIINERLYIFIYF